MAENTEVEGQGGAALSEETARLAALGRGEEPAAEAANEGKAEEGKEAAEAPQRPDHIPEKFWDAEKGEVNLDNLLKSYKELEKARNEKPKGDEGDGEEGSEEEGSEEEEAGAEETPGGIAPELFASAQTEYAEKGELSDKTRKAIIAGGVPEETLDTYLAGVAALSAAMTEQVYETAGGKETYEAALKWAGESWNEARITKFNKGIDDPDLRESLIKGLMADYHAANPGEGSLTRPGGGGNGDLYASHDEFVKDLQKADAEGDTVARKQAVDKWARTRKSGSVQMPRRRGMDRFAV